MSAMDPDEVAITGPPAEPVVGTEVLERLAWLDLSDAQDRFARGVDDAPYYVASQTGMEYRRFLLLRLAYPQLDIRAPPLLDRCWRLHAADRSSLRTANRWWPAPTSARTPWLRRRSHASVRLIGRSEISARRSSLR